MKRFNRGYIKLNIITLLFSTIIQKFIMANNNEEEGNIGKPMVARCVPAIVEIFWGIPIFRSGPLPADMPMTI